MLTFEEVQLPDWSPVQEVLGGGVEEIRLPDGSGYGGADTWSAQSKDGCLYAVLCMERPNQKFGTYAFRRKPDGQMEWITLQEFTESRVTVSEEPQPFLTWLAVGDRVLKRAQLPGFIPQTATSVATPVQVVPTAGGSSGGSGTDSEARKLAEAARSESKRADQGQDARINAMEQRIIEFKSQLIVLENNIPHHVWRLLSDKLPDALYVLLQSNNAGIVGQLLRIVAEAGFKR